MLVDIIYHSKNPSLSLLQQFRLNLTQTIKYRIDLYVLSIQLTTSKN